MRLVRPYEFGLGLAAKRVIVCFGVVNGCSMRAAEEPRHFANPQQAPHDGVGANGLRGAKRIGGVPEVFDHNQS